MTFKVGESVNAPHHLRGYYGCAVLAALLRWWTS